MIWLGIILTPLILACVYPMLRPRGLLAALLLGGAAVPALCVGGGLVTPEPREFDWLFLGASFNLDVLRTVFLAFTALLWAVAGWFAGYYESDDARRGRFGFFFLASMAGNFGLIIAADVPGFYACFVLMTFAAYGLVIHSATTEAVRAGRVYLMMAIFGEVFLLAALYLAVQAAGGFDWAAIGPAVALADNRNLILWLALIGFGVKAGAVPLYFWLPLAHPVAPTPASAVLSGAMIKAGLIGWLHVFPVGELMLPGWSGLLIAAGLIAALGGVAIGLFQTDPKTNLAYSSISQMGVMTVLFGITLVAGPNWEIVALTLALYACNHALAKGALFLGTGVVIATGHQRMLILAGLALAALAIAGAPFTGGAVAKYAMKDAALLAPGFWPVALAILLPLSALGTALLLGRFLWLCADKKATSGQAPKLNLVLPWAFLLAMVLLVPFQLNRHVVTEVAGLAFPSGGIFAALWPILLAGLILLAASRLSGRRLLNWTIPPGDGIVLIERGLQNLRAYWQRGGRGFVNRGAINFVSLSDRILDFEKTKAVVDRIEARLGSWNLVGFLFVVLVLLCIYLL